MNFIKELDLISFDLKSPERFKKNNPINLDNKYKFLLVSKNKALSHKEECFVKNFLFSIAIDFDEVFIISKRELWLLDQHELNIVWYVGTPSVEINEVVILESPKISLLMQSAQFKKDLWKQFCKNAHYLSSYNSK